MRDNVYLCLSDLLDQDTSSNEFFQTLSPSVQKMLMTKDIGTFEELQKCAKAYRKSMPDKRASLIDGMSSACSANDCTGLVPQGSDMTSDEYKTYQQVYPFGESDV